MDLIALPERQADEGESIHAVQNNNGGERLTLALLFRVYKPFDDYLDALEKFAEEHAEKERAKLAQKEELEKGGPCVNEGNAGVAHSMPAKGRHGEAGGGSFSRNNAAETNQYQFSQTQRPLDPTDIDKVRSIMT